MTAILTRLTADLRSEPATELTNACGVSHSDLAVVRCFGFCFQPPHACVDRV